MKAVQVNVSVNVGSTGRIAEGIARQWLALGHESYIAYGRSANPSVAKLIKIGNRLNVWQHVVRTRLTDQHGLGSKKATQRFVRELEQLDPDIIHLHNIHGYFLHYEVLFSYLKQKLVPIIWTLHDTWSFTGHCANFLPCQCFRWQTECHSCPLLGDYPTAFIDSSRSNYRRKKAAFSGLEKAAIVTPSHWLADHVKDSFLQEYPVTVIRNGIDLSQFQASPDICKENLVLGVANVWTTLKGLNDFFLLRELLPSDLRIVLIGLSDKQIQSLPAGIEGVRRTESIQDLAAWYSRAAVFVNPTYSDNFPTTNLEALACGTPVITYDTGGSPEAVTPETGIIVPKGDVNALANAIRIVLNSPQSFHRRLCRDRAMHEYCVTTNFKKYMQVYDSLAGSRV